VAGLNIAWLSPAAAGFVLGPLLFLLMQLLPVFPDAHVANMASIAALMVVWWITEALPLAATALLPLLLFPLLGITSGVDVAETYMNSTIFLFIGGFVLALSMQRWDLHTRIALRVIGWFHGSARLMLLGFMVTSALLSMWISNTATATMLLPIGLAVHARASEQLDESERQALLTALMLGIAYSCSIGGIATLIGTPPNMAMQRIFAITFPSAPEISFAQWLVFALPMAVCLLLLCWGVISVRYTGRNFTPLHFTTDSVRKLARKPMAYEEKAVAVVFALAAVGWIFRKRIVIGDFTLPGWSGLFENAQLLNDGSVAIAAALALFCLPARNREKYARLADAQTIAKMPWNIVLLFGGGFALAKGFTDSGLSAFIGNGFIGMQQLDTSAMVAGITTVVVFLTEVTSNTATAQMMLPLVAGIARSIGVNPLLLMLPVTLAASMAFMMPVATPPNAIVFASGRLRIRDMITTGFIINIIAIGMITLLTLTIGVAVFGIDASVPGWVD
jgi:solute carrier family 13 (sodium-dependent dicarboxylate transporter), member 2/3/5